MAGESQEQEPKGVWTDVGVRVGKENALGAMIVKVEPVKVRGEVRPVLVGGGKKKNDKWEDVKAD